MACTMYTGHSRKLKLQGLRLFVPATDTLSIIGCCNAARENTQLWTLRQGAQDCTTMKGGQPSLRVLCARVQLTPSWHQVLRRGRTVTAQVERTELAGISTVSLLSLNRSCVWSWAIICCEDVQGACMGMLSRLRHTAGTYYLHTVQCLQVINTFESL